MVVDEVVDVKHGGPSGNDDDSHERLDELGPTQQQHLYPSERIFQLYQVSQVLHGHDENPRNSQKDPPTRSNYRAASRQVLLRVALRRSQPIRLDHPKLSV